MNSPTASVEPPSGPSISGRTVVIAMFAFGAVATLILFVYWNLHMMPFMPMQEALVAEFGEDCAPRVEGGQRKIHKHSTKMLRVVLKVPFNPKLEAPTTAERVNEHLVKVRDIAAKNLNLDDYDTLELHLFQDKQESRFPQITVRKNIASWEDVNEDGTPVDATQA